MKPQRFYLREVAEINNYVAMTQVYKSFWEDKIDQVQFITETMRFIRYETSIKKDVPADLRTFFPFFQD